MRITGSVAVLKVITLIVLLWIPLVIPATEAEGYHKQQISRHVQVQLKSEPVSVTDNNTEVAGTMTFEELFRKMQSQTAGLLGDGYRQALPLPVRHGDTVSLNVIIAPSLIREPEGTIIYPPSYLGVFDRSDGSLLKLSAVEPSDFGQSHPTQEPLGVANMPEGMTFEQFMNLRAELFSAYDLLVPAFSGKEARLDKPQYEAAQRFLTLFPQLSEAVLKPYYEHVGKEFFGWLLEKRGQ
jgi:hypothetical protein